MLATDDGQTKSTRNIFNWYWEWYGIGGIIMKLETNDLNSISKIETTWTRKKHTWNVTIADFGSFENQNLNKSQHDGIISKEQFVIDQLEIVSRNKVEILEGETDEQSPKEYSLKRSNKIWQKT